MRTAQDLLEERYLAPLRENPTLYIGVELEYPIVNRSGEATDLSLCCALMRVIVEKLGFMVLQLDRQGNPVQLQHENGDCILFEVSYNTLEFAFAKATCIQEIDQRLSGYLSVIQAFLRQSNHELQGKGINPNWQKNDHRPVDLPRYQLLMDFLALSNGREDCHSYPAYGAFICGNQVQFDVARKEVLRVLHAFNQIEAVKAYLFANSPFPEWDRELKLTRDRFWEESMHGLFEENVGLYKEELTSEKEYLEYMARSALFYVRRGEELYYFEPIRACDYLQQERIRAYDRKGEGVTLVPEEADFQFHRSYHYQELTGRGTVEFRSICTQPFERTFAPIAFHLGLLVELDAFESLISETSFFSILGRDTAYLRRHFSKKQVASEEEEAMCDFAERLLACARQGLQKRGMGEEIYLVDVL